MASVVATASVLVLILFCFSFNVFQPAAAAAEYSGSPVPAPAPHDGHHPVAAPSPHYPPTQSPVTHHSPSPSPVTHHSPSPSPVTHHSPSPSPVPHHPPSPSPVPHQSPSPSPVYSPAHHSPAPSPVHVPAQSPKPHKHFPRSFVQVQGVVYCKSCKYPGVLTLLGAKPLSGAKVKLSCKNTKLAPVVETALTDKNGYFLLEAPNNVTSYASNRCRVHLVKSSDDSCSEPSQLNDGSDGAELMRGKAFIDADKKPVVLYNVGPLAFEPTCPR